MKQFLILLVCFAAYASCKNFPGSGSSVHMYEDFYELCSDDRFEYNGFKVNSFVTVRGYVELHPIGDYALSEAVNYYRLFNDTEADQLEEIRDSYHFSLIRMYGKHYFNNPNYENVENLMYKQVSDHQANLTSFRGKGKNAFVADVVLGLQNKVMEQAKNLTLILHTFKSETPAPEKDSIGHLDHHLVALRHLSNTTIVFPKEDAADLFKKLIYKSDRFEPIRRSKLFNEWKEDSGKLFFNMHVPFEQNDSMYVNKTRPCVVAKDLPKFFQLKGQIGN